MKAKDHYLKTWPEYYEAVLEGTKTFEVRKNDRNYQIGDTLVLEEFDPSTESYTGRIMTAEVCYLLNGPAFGIEAGYCVMGIE